MALTPAQIQTLKAEIATNPLYAADVASGNDSAVVSKLNAPAAPDYYVWRDLPMEAVLNTIAFANMTPADAVPTTPALTVDVYRARALACQGKQFNLQNLTLGRTIAPMKRANYRAALQDCLTAIPAGAGTFAAPSDLTFEGDVSESDVVKTREV